MRQNGRGPAFHQYSERVYRYAVADLDAYLAAVRSEPTTRAQRIARQR